MEKTVVHSQAFTLMPTSDSVDLATRISTGQKLNIQQTTKNGTFNTRLGIVISRLDYTFSRQHP